MNPTSTRQKIKDLKTKMNNLELEVRSLISRAEFEPGTIDAIHQDISNFTDEIRDINKQLLSLKSKEKNESLSLMNVYESMIEGQRFNYKIMDKISIDVEELFNKIGKYDKEWVNKKIDNIIIDLNNLKK